MVYCNQLLSAKELIQRNIKNLEDEAEENDREATALEKQAAKARQRAAEVRAHIKALVLAADRADA